jgi:hypothetical protein
MVMETVFIHWTTVCTSRAKTGMKRNLKQTLESAADPRVKLQARAIAVDCYKRAIKYVNNQEKKLLKDTRDKGNEDDIETTNGVF